MSKPQESVDPIAAKFDEVLARGLTLKERFANIIGSVREALAAGKYPESRRADVERKTLEYIDEIARGDIVARANVDQYVSITDKFCRELRTFEREIPQPSQREQWQWVAVRLGWDDELNLLLKALTPGETIAALEWDHAVTSSGREVSRHALRLSRKESYSPFSDDEFIALNFKPMRNPRADEEPADMRVVYSEQR